MFFKLCSQPQKMIINQFVQINGTLDVLYKKGGEFQSNKYTEYDTNNANDEETMRNCRAQSVIARALCKILETIRKYMRKIYAKFCKIKKIGKKRKKMKN